MRIVAFAPIRLNSKRVSQKNLRLLGNKPLMSYILETLTQVESIDDVYAYCSSREIQQYCPAGVQFLQRPAELDGDEVLGEQIYSEFLKTIDADIYVLAHTTSPFIKASTIQHALNKIIKEDYDSAFSAEKIQTFAWFEGKPLNYQLNHIPRTQTIEPVFIETSAFYIFRKEVWTEQHQRIGSNPYISVIDKIEGVDIDWPEDFNFAEHILTQR